MASSSSTVSTIRTRRQQSLKRASFHENDQDSERQPIKRQMSTRTLAAIKLEEMHLTQADPYQEHQVPSVSPNCPQIMPGNGSSFFPEEIELEKKQLQENLISQDQVNSSPLDTLAVLEAGERLGLDEEEIIQCATTTCDCSHTDVEVNGFDETDGPFSAVKSTFKCVERTLNDFRDDVCDAGAYLINSFTSHFPYLGQECDESTDDGFTVHLPNPMGNPVSFGINLRRQRRGCKITRVRPQSLADRVGLRESDILTRVDDVELEREDDGGVVKLFMKLKETFSLAFLREQKVGDHTKLVEIKINVTITIDTVERVFEVKVHVSRNSFRRITTSGPRYISQDPDMKGESYLNLDGNRVFMGYDVDDKAKFQLDIYVPNVFRRGQMCVIRKWGSNMVFNPAQSGAEEMNPNVLKLECLLHKDTNDDGTYCFESLQKKGTYVTNNSGNLVLSRESALSMFQINEVTGGN